MTSASTPQRGPFSVLVIEDDEPMLRLLASILEEESFNVSTASSFVSASVMLQSHPFDVVLSDIHLGEQKGYDLIGIKSPTGRNPIYVFITGQAGMTGIATALQKGAFDYLPKPLAFSDLRKMIQTTFQRVVTRLNCAEGMTALASSRLATEDRMIGRSLKMIEMYRVTAQASLSRGSVIILGETGTGKELVASTIHRLSTISERPFVAVNCGALTESLLESELFGYVRGAFTGASGNKVGLFEEASGGTLFLDEIGDISPGLQVKLLRTIQSGEIKPVGSTQNRHVKVRIIAATHRNLPELVREGKFREDLFYRLKVFLIDIPPLRERREDIPELVHSFIDQHRSYAAKRIRGIATETMTLLRSYDWPGNVRELENVIIRALVSATDDIIFPDDLPDEFHRAHAFQRTSPPEASADAIPAVPTNGNGSFQTLSELERDHIVDALRTAKFRRTEAARLLGISRVTLYRKAAKYGITLNTSDWKG